MESAYAVTIDTKINGIPYELLRQHCYWETDAGRAQKL